MQNEYNFDCSIKNPYVSDKKTRITIGINDTTVEYFKRESARTGIPYQNLINLYLSQCVREDKRFRLCKRAMQC